MKRLGWENFYRMLYFKYQREEFILDFYEINKICGMTYNTYNMTLSKLRSAGLIDTVRRYHNGKLTMFARLLDIPYLQIVEKEYNEWKSQKEKMD